MQRLYVMDKDAALRGRQQAMPVPAAHAVLGSPMTPPFPLSMQVAMFGMGCFWGAEKRFWQTAGVFTTAVGYSAGVTPNPTYEEVCSGMTGHNEVVLVVYDPRLVSYQSLLRVFWQNHNPTQGLRQGNDIGPQYRSGIYTFSDEQQQQALASRNTYQLALEQADGPQITTEITQANDFYYAEPYHQQYLHKNPKGYCPDISCYATGLPVFPQ